MKHPAALILTFLSFSLPGCVFTPPSSAGGIAENSEFIRDPASVTGKTWEWLSTVTPVERIDVAEPGMYTILLLPDGKLTARFDCNRGGGDYSISDGAIEFGPLISTRMACPEGSLDAVFMRDLGRVTSYFVRNGELYLEMPYDSGTLRFRQSDP